MKNAIFYIIICLYQKAMYIKNVLSNFSMTKKITDKIYGDANLALEKETLTWRLRK